MERERSSLFSRGFEGSHTFIGVGKIHIIIGKERTFANQMGETHQKRDKMGPQCALERIQKTSIVRVTFVMCP